MFKKQKSFEERMKEQGVPVIKISGELRNPNRKKYLRKPKVKKSSPSKTKKESAYVSTNVAIKKKKKSKINPKTKKSSKAKKSNLGDWI